MRKSLILISCLLIPGFMSFGQNEVSKVWVADLGDGTYKNPILHADYSDPDVIMVAEMNGEGTAVTGNEVMVFDGHHEHPTVEGPKFYKRNGYYYIFAPAGGVTTGWQMVLRSRQIYGPYDEKIVLAQGTGKINGPHQGAWITTATGEDWFIPA